MYRCRQTLANVGSGRNLYSFFVYSSLLCSARSGNSIPGNTDPPAETEPATLNSCLQLCFFSTNPSLDRKEDGVEDWEGSQGLGRNSKEISRWGTKKYTQVANFDAGSGTFPTAPGFAWMLLERAQPGFICIYANKAFTAVQKPPLLGWSPALWLDPL